MKNENRLLEIDAFRGIGLATLITFYIEKPAANFLKSKYKAIMIQKS